MNTAIGTPHYRRNWRAALGLVVTFGSGCSLTVADRAPHVVPAAAPHLLYRVSELSPAARSVQLVPQELDRTATFGETLGARLYVGGIASFTEGNSGHGPDRLALVILAANDSIQPVLRESRQLLLDIDGHLFQTRPTRDPRLYSFESTESGHTETVIVPIDRRLLTLIVEADSVRGRVGHWLSFDLEEDVRHRLGELLTALPEDFLNGRRRVASTPLHRATY